MKLCRIGEIENEKPAILDEENNYRDLSSIIPDLNPETLNFDTIEKIKTTNISNLPKLDSNSRIRFFFCLLIELREFLLNSNAKSTASN